MIEDAAVHAVGDAFAETWNRHDMTAFAALFTGDASFVNVRGDRLDGRQAIEAQHAAIHATVFRETVLTIRAADVHPLGDAVAALHLHWQLSGILPPGGGVAPDRTGRLLLVLQRGTEGWRIVEGQNTDIVTPA